MTKKKSAVGSSRSAGRRPTVVTRAPVRQALDDHLDAQLLLAVVEDMDRVLASSHSCSSCGAEVRARHAGEGCGKCGAGGEEYVLEEPCAQRFLELRDELAARATRLERRSRRRWVAAGGRN